ncbi:MAG TPA: PAS domain S-box protein [Anaeromyxobacteraceae bacterium]|jgi:PAS domain S-box-containing protein|nr:PAS domain S-box protein [Anaeromyxobacteraceae bacterium]
MSPPTHLDVTQPADLAPLGAALSALGIGLTLVDRDLRVDWANEQIRAQAAELSCGGHHCFASLWKKDQRCADCLPLLVFRTGEPQEGVRERARPGGEVEAWRVRAVPVRDAAGALRWVAESFVRLSSLVPDLAGGSRRLAAETAAARGAAFLVVDGEERIVSWGSAAEAIFGYPQEEALGRRVDLLVPEDRREEERRVAAQVATEGQAPRFETVRRARDGRLVPVALSAVALRDEAGRLIGRSCVVEDLSALDRLRGRVAAQEQLLAHITREAADAILAVDAAGTVTSFNRGAERLLGLTAAELVGRPLSRVVDGRELARLVERAERRGAVRGARLTFRDARGEAIPVEVSAAVLGDGGGVALVARDASGRERLERQLMRSEKLAVVGSLAAGLAHEIGSPLTAISATAEYLLIDARDEAQRKELAAIVGETDRIGRLVRELLGFARSTPRRPQPVALGEAVERVRGLLRIPAEKRRVRLLCELPPGLPPVLCDPDALHQVLLNLLLNAVAAVAEGGRVGVRARLEDEAGEPAVTLEVHDDGPGVPEPLRERIFDPFFTTRSDGTGLGLAVCAQAVASQGGDIRVGTGPLGGASFLVQLPAAPAPAGPAEVAP